MESRLEHIRSLNLSKLSDDDLIGYYSYLNKELLRFKGNDDPVIKNMQVEFCYVTREVEKRPTLPLSLR